MLENFIQNYYSFFDEKLRSSTIVVLFITLLIFTAGSVNAMNTHYLKGNILESENSIQKNIGMNTVIIDGIEYELIFSRVN